MWLTFLVLPLVAACGQASKDGAGENARNVSSKGKVHALTIYGYNYTNRSIAQFEVNGQGGGDLSLSTPTSSGGGGLCCISWVTGTYLPATVHVRWASSTCLATVTNSFGEVRQVGSDTFSEVNVQLKGPVPSDPQYFEVHFYPDGHVEVAITKEASDPRLKLPASRQLPRSEENPPCKDSTR